MLLVIRMTKNIILKNSLESSLIYIDVIYCKYTLILMILFHKNYSCFDFSAVCIFAHVMYWYCKNLSQLENHINLMQNMSPYAGCVRIYRHKHIHLQLNKKVHCQKIIWQISLVINICCGFINNDYFVSFQ